MTDYLNGKTVLVTGGTGSFGKAFVNRVLADFNVKKLIVFSRDELKQYEMQQAISDDRLRYFIGDVRDYDRVQWAFRGVDVVVHAAALKQVPAGEYNPEEFIKTNVDGSRNVAKAAIQEGVRRVVGLSTDKAVSPINVYGSTKHLAERVFTSYNSYVGTGPTKLCAVRYGNVIGSRGSVVPVFKAKALSGEPIPVTHPDMTRFWLKLSYAVDFVLEAIECVQGSEVFVPKIPSSRILDVAEAIAPANKVVFTGIRPGEKLHEVLISEAEGRRTVDHGTKYAIMPHETKWKDFNFIYDSQSNQQKLTVEQIRKLIL